MAHCSPFAGGGSAAVGSVATASVAVFVASAACKLTVAAGLNKIHLVNHCLFALTSHVCHRHE